MFSKLNLLPLTAILLFSAFIFSCDFFNPKPVTVSIYSDSALDGRVSWDDSSPDPVYSFSAGDASVSIGDAANDIGSTQAYVSFDVSDIPAGAVISSALLRVYQTSQASGTSYGVDNLGAVLVDNISYDALEASNELFNASTTGTDIGLGPLASSYAADTWHELSVLESAKDEFAHYHNGKIQFRLYHNIGNDNDDIADTDGWAMGEDSAHRPELVITYTK